MNRWVGIGLGVALALVIGSLIWLSLQADPAPDSIRSDDTEQQTGQETYTSGEPRQTERQEEPATETAVQEGNYVDYSSDKLAEAATKNNVLFFHSKTCVICNSIEQNINAQTIPSDITIFKVDYDSDQGQQLAEQYGVPYQYTFVNVTQDGTKLKLWTGNFDTGVQEIAQNF